MVVISRPSTSAASERHDFTRLPSISTVQAPHWPRPQPFFEPVRCRCSRRASSSVVRGSSVSRCSVPLTRSTTSSGAGAASAPCATAGDRAPGMSCPPTRAPPVTAASSSSSRRVTSELVIVRLLELAELVRTASQRGSPVSDLSDANSRPHRSYLGRARPWCAPLKRGSDQRFLGGDFPTERRRMSLNSRSTRPCAGEPLCGSFARRCEPFRVISTSLTVLRPSCGSCTRMRLPAMMRMSL